MNENPRLTGPESESRTNLHVDPFQLAKMAALLDKNACFDQNLDISSDVNDPRFKWEIHFAKTAALLLRAQTYTEKFNSLHIADQLSELGNDGAFATWAIARPQPKLVLLPYPKDKSSELVGHLAAALSGYGCDWKSERSILENLRRWFVDRANRHNEQFAAKIAELEIIHESMAEERNTTVLQLRYGMGIPDDEKWEDALEDYKDFIWRCEVREPTSLETRNETLTEGSGKLLRYEFPKSSIDSFCEWVKWTKKKRKPRVTFKELFAPVKQQIRENFKKSTAAMSNRNT